MPEPDSRNHQTRSGRAADYEGRGRHRHKLAIQDYAGPWRGTIRRPVRHGHALNGASVRKMKSHWANPAMRDDPPVFFENVASAAVPTVRGVEVLPLQELWIGVWIRRAELIHADEEIGESRDVFRFSGSDGRGHYPAIVI